MDDFDVPVFKKTCDLYKLFYSYRNFMSKQDRYTIWQRCDGMILDILEGILAASQMSGAAKIPTLERTSMKLNFLRVFVRLMRETDGIDQKKYIALQEPIDEVGRQLGGWMRFEK